MSPEIRKKYEKFTKSPTPGRTPKIRKKYRKNTKMAQKSPFLYFFCIFFVFLGPDPGWGVSYFFRIFFVWLEGFSSSIPGTQNRKTSLEKLTLTVGASTMEYENQEQCCCGGLSPTALVLSALLRGSGLLSFGSVAVVASARISEDCLFIICLSGILERQLLRNTNSKTFHLGALIRHLLYKYATYCSKQCSCSGKSPVYLTSQDETQTKTH